MNLHVLSVQKNIQNFFDKKTEINSDLVQNLVDKNKEKW